MRSSVELLLAPRGDQAQKHLFKLTHRDYTCIYASDDGDKGMAECRFDVYRTWVEDPRRAQQMVEAITRESIGVTGCPIDGTPQPQKMAAE